MLSNIGIIGRARVGKDTAGAWLVEHRGYVRVSFADPIKEAALRLDPIMYDLDAQTVEEFEYDDAHVRLHDVVQALGWERAKEEVPEVRRILQELGMSIREIGPDFWLRAALAKVKTANEVGNPVVITDVRFGNEADSLRSAGFDLVYIDRPGIPELNHESEGALSAEEADHYVLNNRDIFDLHEEMSTIADHARRHAVRTNH